MSKKEQKIIYSGADNHPYNQEPSLAHQIAKRNNAVLVDNLKERLSLPTKVDVRTKRPLAIAENQEYNGYTVLSRRGLIYYKVMCNQCGEILSKDRASLEFKHHCKTIPKTPPTIPDRFKEKVEVKAGDRFGTLTASHQYSPKIWFVRCDCGKELKLNASSLVGESNKRTSCSAPSCRKRAKILRESNWIGQKSFDNPSKIVQQWEST